MTKDLTIWLKQRVTNLNMDWSFRFELLLKKYTQSNLIDLKICSVTTFPIFFLWSIFNPFCFFSISVRLIFFFYFFNPCQKIIKLIANPSRKPLERNTISNISQLVYLAINKIYFATSYQCQVLCSLHFNFFHRFTVT